MRLNLSSLLLVSSQTAVPTKQRLVLSRMSSTQHRFVDIGANLLDERFTEGSYHGKVRHEPDFHMVLQRAADIGMRHMILTAGTLVESREAVRRVRELRISNQTDCQLYCTVGVHPTRCMEFETAESANDNLEELLTLLKDGMTDGVVASVGEVGLDYDRLEFCPKDVQRKYFALQLKLSAETGLPLFLHNRNVGEELYVMLLEHKDKWSSGVVHSFDDTAELARKFIDLGLYIGLNGCSLKTQANLDVVKVLPLDKILLETDCPFCDVKRTHAGFDFVKTHFNCKPEKKFEPGVQVKVRLSQIDCVGVPYTTSWQPNCSF
jgi:TatD DNase family protein